MTKVCHVTSGHGRYDTRIFLKECRSLANSGYDVMLVVSDDGKQEEVQSGVKILPVQGAPVSCFKKRLLKYNRILMEKALTLDADIYHFHEWELLPWTKVLKRRGKKIIFDSHEDFAGSIKNSVVKSYAQKMILLPMYRYFENFAIEYADAIITPCTFNGRHLFADRGKKEVVISNVPRLEDFFDKYKIDCHNKNDCVCYAGHLSYTRGITHLVKAAWRANVKLKLAGVWDSLQYRNEIMNMPEFKNSEYLGVLAIEDLKDFYSSSAAGMSTILNTGQYGTNDNMGTKIYEYMSMGLPVVTNKYKYIDEQNAKYHFCITVNPLNVVEIASAIRQIIDNPQLASQMGKNGHCAIIKEFNWNIEERKLLKLYGEL